MFGWAREAKGAKDSSARAREETTTSMHPHSSSRILIPTYHRLFYILIQWVGAPLVSEERRVID